MAHPPGVFALPSSFTLRPLPGPELRKDPLVERWVIIATERAARPIESAAVAARPSSDPCPFCEGHEALTPHEITASGEPGRRADQPGWQVRVVANKFPALRGNGSHAPGGEGPYEPIAGVGAHEVVIECPTHETSLTALADAHVRDVVCIYRDRLRALGGDPRLAYGMLFKNVGAAAGASLEHAHAQLLGMPILPPVVSQEMNAAQQLFRAHERCFFCEMIRGEAGGRLVLETAGYVAVAPFAARFPFETWILPRRHESDFTALPDAGLAELGSFLKRTLRTVETALEGPAYNYLLHTAPFRSAPLPHYHWHIEILPRLTQVAGFEWGTGCFINPVPPEQAAAFLRGHAAG